ncbi:MAG: 3-phosphoshikimate 1-carboxyvinyltransferase [Aliidiomarina sp.]|uniref:3-phosphoshikimate 1-carboxyvinyltransferase n=1 Tax=Aliidiomarina sp. TaxID=1872439 RepID=UPI0025BA8CA6|nr:3-phosphoshikimate 1-carboxyvinyltransferase [Aliidiomarina sp.]MCH8500338.1 3-phosphoshikimate 1-carboxyvinyltransferase [Aliidiomarina sp.]
MKLDFRPQCSGEIYLPGSKSIANRALLLAALADGTTILENMLDSDDTRYMRSALRDLGITINEVANVASEQTADTLVIGNNGLFTSQSSPLALFLGNAGTAMRPLTAALAASAGEFSLSGEPRMHERPIGPLVDALNALGADIRYAGEQGFPPLNIKGRSLRGGKVTIDGSMSSQFISALLMVLPLLPENSEVELSGTIVSAPYIELTIAMMRQFGAEVEWCSPRCIQIVGNRGYKSPGRYWIEGDASSASYFLAAAAIAGGTIRVHGVGKESLQGDKAFAKVLAAMGAEVDYQPRSIAVTRGQKPLQGGDFDLNAIPDAAMTIATTALFAEGTTAIRNIYNWRLKESDRLHAMATELRKVGAEVEEYDDAIVIKPPADIRHAEIATYDDHRMAMCFSLLAFSPAGVTILEPDCCRKTYPHFFTDFASVCHPVALR